MVIEFKLFIPNIIPDSHNILRSNTIFSIKNLGFTILLKCVITFLMLETLVYSNNTINKLLFTL